MTIHILFACDDAYWPILHTALTSLCVTNTNNDLTLHLLCDGVSDAGRTAFLRICNDHGNEAILYDVNGESLAHLPTLEYISRSTYCRLLADTLLPDSVGKLLYFDSDVMFRGDIAELYGTDIASMALAGVPEQQGKHNRRLGRPESDRYFNAGVLLINLDYWRTHKIGGRAIDSIINDHEKMTLLDQDALNVLIGQDWHEIPPRWNYIAEQNRMSPCADPAVVHFAGPNKPWDHFSTSPFKAEYRSHVAPEVGHLMLDRDLDIRSLIVSKLIRLMPKSKLRRTMRNYVKSYN